MIDYLTSHLDLNPLALAAFALCAVILACWAAEPWWTKRRRRARFAADRHARVAEDRAWANRAADVELAGRLRFAHFDQDRFDEAQTLAVGIPSSEEIVQGHMARIAHGLLHGGGDETLVGGGSS